MYLQTYVRFNKNERKVIEEKVLPSIGLGLGGIDDEQAAERLRVLRHVASGDGISREKIEQAARFIDLAIIEAQRQAEPEWWRTEAHPGGLAIDPEQFAKDMAANREGQARALAEGAALLLIAREALPVTDFDDDAEVVGGLVSAQ